MQNCEKKNCKKLLLVVIMIAFCLIYRSQESTAVEADPLGFAIEPILPDSQIAKDEAYFYLKTSPGASQKIQVNIEGTSETPVKVKVYTANASTSERGTIDYRVDTKDDESLKNSIQEITQIDLPEFEIKKSEQKKVTININVPNEHYEGIKLGTIYFERIDSEKKKKGEINSTYGYRIGLMISEKDDIYTDGQILKLKKVMPELKRLRKTIQLTLQNPEPKIIDDFSMNVAIINKKNGKIVKKQELKDGRIAPNSQFDFGVDWGIDPMPVGNYIVKVDAESRHQSWKLKKEFEITNEQAKKINKETVYKLTIPKWGYVVTFFLGLTVLCDVIYLSVRQKKWEKKARKEKRKMKKKKKNRE